MNKLLFLLSIFFATNCVAQNQLPNAKVKTLSGKSVDFNSVIAQGDTTTIVSFWATWCIPCITEMETINDLLPAWKKEAIFKFVTVSVDDARTSAKVKSVVKGKGWDFSFYLDANNDLKRALNVNDIPHIIMIKKGSIVYQHTGYVPGNEEEIIAKVKKL